MTGKPILYRRHWLPFREELPLLQQQLVEREVKLLVIDSAGPAVGGNLSSEENVMPFLMSLRALGLSTLIIAHVAKMRRGSTSRSLGAPFSKTSCARSGRWRRPGMVR